MTRAEKAAAKAATKAAAEENAPAAMPGGNLQNGVQIRIVQLVPILAKGKLCLSGLLATDKKSYCMAAKPAE